MSAGTILIVDDIATNRKLLRQMLLKMAEYTVVEAVNGKEAVVLFEQENPDLVLMDINMPEMDGLQSTSEIKKLSGDSYIPVIFVTALSAESSLTNALAAGGDDFVSKPFDADVLKSKINAHLRIRDLNQQLTVKNNQLSGVNEQLTREQELIEHFFKSALQQSDLDDRFIKYHMSSMSTFNGDIFLVARSPKGGLYIVMGDFTGHGLTAAMGTLPVAMIFFEMVSESAAVSDIARELNRQLFKLMPTSMFFAAGLFELNSKGNILTSWMGGMPECYWIVDDGGLKGTIQSRHMPLGILHDNGFDSGTEIHNVAENDKLYLYSDGVTEAHRPNGEMFGNERLKETLLSTNTNRIEKVLGTLNDFTGSSDQNDDITLIELSCHEMVVTESSKNNVDVDTAVLPWEMSFQLTENEIRNGEPLVEISNAIGSLPIVKKHKGIIETLLSEIYFNALDYSILGLGSLERQNEEEFDVFYKTRELKLNSLEGATIRFYFKYFSEEGNSKLLIRINDNGDGYKGHSTDPTTDKLHGRGIAIISELCESVAYSDEGRTLELVYQL